MSSPTTSQTAKAPPMPKLLPSSAPSSQTPAVSPLLTSVERAKLAALERFKADQAHSPDSLPVHAEVSTSEKPPAKVSNKELLQGLDEEEGDVRCYLDSP